MPSLAARWEAAARLVAEHRDVLDARLDDEGGARTARATLDARGWSAFLLALDDARLAALEIAGPDPDALPDAPASLRAMVTRAREVCALDAFHEPTDGHRAARRRETPRKYAQVEAFARVVLPLAARASRVVDVGSGHGHLTRALAERIDRPVVGLERSGPLAARARALDALAPSAATTFEVTDVLRDGLGLRAGDCAVGLHACGELGDAIVTSAAAVGASVALVGCCLQKRRELVRLPLGSPSPLLAGGASGAFASSLALPRTLLGLSNLTSRDAGVERTRTENLAGRERRLALRRLLTERDVALGAGAEIEGLNRRAAQGDLPSLVARAFAHRGLRMPTRTEIASAARWAHAHHAAARRLSLPRWALARALEVFVLLDRARHLQERGHAVTVGVLFPARVSGRNLMLVAEPRR